MFKKKDNKKFNFLLTNFFTAVRMVGVVALIPVFKLFGGFTTTMLSAGCFITDTIDGILARSLESSTFFGSLFDGTADKAFLIASMVLLMSITPLAIIPIILELAIAGVQSIKYHSNMNVQSNFIGKAKTCVAGVLVSLSYTLVDIPFLTKYLGADLATKIAEMDHIKLFGAILAPVVLSELVTLGSYIKEYYDEKKELTPEKVEERKRELARIEEEMKDVELQDLLFEHEYYEKYKDCGNLRLIRNLTKKKAGK